MFRRLPLLPLPWDIAKTILLLLLLLLLLLFFSDDETCSSCILFTCLPTKCEMQHTTNNWTNLFLFVLNRLPGYQRHHHPPHSTFCSILLSGFHTALAFSARLYSIFVIISVSLKQEIISVNIVVLFVGIMLLLLVGNWLLPRSLLVS